MEYLLVVVVVFTAVLGFAVVYGGGLNAMQTALSNSISQIIQSAPN